MHNPISHLEYTQWCWSSRSLSAIFDDRLRLVGFSATHLDNRMLGERGNNADLTVDCTDEDCGESIDAGRDKCHATSREPSLNIACRALRGRARHTLLSGHPSMLQLGSSNGVKDNFSDSGNTGHGNGIVLYGNEVFIEPLLRQNFFITASTDRSFEDAQKLQLLLELVISTGHVKRSRQLITEHLRTPIHRPRYTNICPII